MAANGAQDTLEAGALDSESDPLFDGVTIEELAPENNDNAN